MTEAQSTINDEIERYLRTGESDPLSAAWSGSFMERANVPTKTFVARSFVPSGCGLRD